MAYEPTLSEITGIRGDAEMGTAGLNSTEIKPDNSLAYLQMAANAHAEADKRTLERYNKNLDEALKNVSEIDYKNVLDSDYGDVSQMAKGVYKSLYDNIDVVRNPLKDPARAAQVKAAEAEMRAQIGKSQVDKTFYDTSKQFLSANPAWNTPENIQKLENFYSSPRDQRRAFQFTPPFTADITAAALAVTKASQAQVASSDVVPGGKYIRTKEGVIIDREKAAQVLESMTNGNDVFGRNVLQGFGALLKNLPAEEQAKYADVKDFVTKNVLAQVGLDQWTKNTLDPNQVWLQDDQQRFTAGQNALNRSMEQQRINLQAQAQKGGGLDINAAGELKNKVLTSLLTTGYANPAVLQDIYGDSSEIKKKSVVYNGKDALGLPLKVGENEIKVPATSVVGSSLAPDGRVKITIRDNATGRTSDIYKSQNDLSDDLNNLAGKANAAKIEHASREYNQKNSGSANFNLQWSKKHFGVAPESKYKGQVILQNGKQVPESSLSYYTDEQIDQAIADKKLTLKK